MMRVKTKRLHSSKKSTSQRTATGPSDGSIKLRIHYLYERALRRFKGNLSLWLQYLEHCKRVGATKRLGKALARCLKLHPRAPEVWCYAADIEVEANGNVEGARTLLQKALRLNPKCEPLWHELFGLELHFANRLYERRKALGITGKVDEDFKNEDRNGKHGGNDDDDDDDDDEKEGEEDGRLENGSSFWKKAPSSSQNAMNDIMRGGIAHIVFQKALQTIHKPSVSFLSGFLKVLSDYKPHFLELGKTVCSALKSTHSNDAIAWEQIAKYFFGFSGTDAALQVFREGLSICGTESMYCLAVDAMQEHSQSLFSANERKEAKKLLLEIVGICENASQIGVLGEKLIQRYVKVLLHIGRRREALEAVTKASKLTPQSCKVWLLLLRIHTRLTTDDDFESAHLKLIEEAIDHIPLTQSTPLWLYAADWCESLDQSETIDWLLSRLEWALSVGGQIGTILQRAATRVIDVVTVRHGVKRAREYTDKLFSLPKPGLSFMLHCIDFEMKQLAQTEFATTDRILSLLESAIAIYGDEEYDLWLRRWRLEKDRNGNSGKVYWRAIKTLKDSKPFVDALQGSQCRGDS